MGTGVTTRASDPYTTSDSRDSITAAPNLTILALTTPQECFGVADISQISYRCQPGCIEVRRWQEDIPAGRSSAAEVIKFNEKQEPKLEDSSERGGSYQLLGCHAAPHDRS